MGAIGAAVATDISQAISCIVSFMYMYKKYPEFRFARSELKFDRKEVENIVKVGFPIMLQQTVAAFGIIFIQRAVNGYGQTMTASFTVGSRIEMYVQMPLNSFYMALATFVGQNIGAGEKKRVRQGASQTLMLSFVVTTIIALCVVVFEKQIIALFGVFQGAGDGFAITRTAVVALSIRVLTTYTFCYLPVFSYRIIWWNMIFGFGGGFIITWVHYLSGKWLNKNIMESYVASDC